jgi:hypothetical protein
LTLFTDNFLVRIVHPSCAQDRILGFWYPHGVAEKSFTAKLEDLTSPQNFEIRPLLLDLSEGIVYRTHARTPVIFVVARNKQHLGFTFAELPKQPASPSRHDSEIAGDNTNILFLAIPGMDGVGVFLFAVAISSELQMLITDYLCFSMFPRTSLSGNQYLFILLATYGVTDLQVMMQSTHNPSVSMN